MEKTFTVYVADKKELESYQEKLKQKNCPYCKRFGTLNRHGSLRGHDVTLKASDQKLLRGKRVYCSNRGRRGGCGRTFSILFSYLLKGFIVSCQILDCFLKNLSRGQSIKSSWQQSTTSFCLENGYRLLNKFQQAQCHLRTALFRKHPPALTGKNPQTTEPLWETIGDLNNAFDTDDCVPSAFQHHFQKGLFPD